MIPCHEAPTNHPVIQEDGSVQCTLSEADAMGSDACERAVLQTTSPALRQGLLDTCEDGVTAERL